MTTLQTHNYSKEENFDKKTSFNKIFVERPIPKKIVYSTKPKPLRRSFWVSFERYRTPDFNHPN